MSIAFPRNARFVGLNACASVRSWLRALLTSGFIVLHCSNYTVFSGTQCPDHDELVVHDEKRLHWISGDRSRVFTSQSGPVLHSVWCTFVDADDSRERYSPRVDSSSTHTVCVARSLCVLHPSSITVYSPHGDVHTVTLPCKARRIWALLEGLLVERDTQADADDTDSPALFTLLRPLEELKPVRTYSASGDERQSQEQFEYSSDPQQGVVFASTSQPFIVTYHEQTQLHSVWALRQSREEVIKRVRPTLQDADAAAGQKRSELALFADPIGLRLQRTFPC